MEAPVFSAVCHHRCNSQVVTGRLRTHAATLASPPTPSSSAAKLEKIRQSDATVHATTSHVLLPELFLAMACLGLVAPFGVCHLVPDHGREHQQIGTTRQLRFPQRGTLSPQVDDAASDGHEPVKVAEL